MLDVILLGIIQGLTEFLPISSSGHLVLFQKLFGLKIYNTIFFDTMLHVGTLLSVVVVFWQDIKSIFLELINLLKGQASPEGMSQRKTLLMLIVATLPLLLVIPFKSRLEAIFENTFLVGVALILTGFFLFYCEKISHGTLDEKTGKYYHALSIGLAQAIAVIPGISRSGATISAARAMGFGDKFAIKISFLMSIVAILGATILQVPDVLIDNAVKTEIKFGFVGLLAAAISGVLSIKLLIKLISQKKFFIFSYYCWSIGVIAIVWSIC